MEREREKERAREREREKERERERKREKQTENKSSMISSPFLHSLEPRRGELLGKLLGNQFRQLP